MTTFDPLLTSIGFERKASLILENLMLLGTASAGSLALKTKIKRPTVYAILDELLEAGVINRSKRGGKTFFHVHDPQELLRELTRNEQKKFNEKLSAIQQLSTILKDIKIREAAMFGEVKVERHRRIQEIELIVEQMLLSGEFIAFFNPNLVSTGHILEVNKEFLRKTAKSKPSIKEIIVDGPKTQWYVGLIKNPNHEVKLLPASTPFELDLIIAKNSILIAQYGALDENSIHITHESFAKSFRVFFNLLWEKL